MNLSLSKIISFASGPITRKLYLHTAIITIFLLFVISITIWAGNTLTMITSIARFERTHTVSRVEAMVALLQYLDNKNPEEMEKYQAKMAITQSYNKVFSQLLDMSKNTPDVEFVKILENTFGETDHKTAEIIVNRIKVLSWHPILKVLVANAVEANAAGESLKEQVSKIVAAKNKDNQAVIFAEIEKAEKRFIICETSFSKSCSALSNQVSSYINYITVALLIISVCFTGLLTYMIAKTIVKQTKKYTSDLEKEIQVRKLTEHSLNESRLQLHSVNEKLQEQNEKLQVNDEELRSQNDHLLATEEMLRIQIVEYETSQKILKESEESLYRQNSLFSSLLQILPIGVFMVEVPSGKPLVANDAAYKLLGRGILPDASKNNLSNVYKAFKAGTRDPYPPEEMPIILGMSGVTSHIDDMEVERPDGTKTLLEIFGAPVTDDKGNIWASLVSFMDITDRKRSELELQESRRLYRNLVEETPDLITRVDTEGRLTFVNNTTLKIYGLPPEECIGRLAFDFIHPDDCESTIAAFNSWLQSDAEIFTHENRQVGISGTDHHHMAWTIRAERDENGTVTGFAGTARDITDSKHNQEDKEKLEAQLHQAQKMDSVGRLAGGVAHDFNNMLTVILGHAQIGLMNTALPPPLKNHLVEIRTAADRSADLTKQLLAFARKQTIAPKVLDLNETVTGMHKMLQRLIGEDIHLNWLPAPNLWNVEVDPSQIDQILANLCVNARDSIADIGKITIETGSSVIDEEYCAHNAGFLAGEYVRLTVSDDGCGMGKETLAQIFEPFFTTKGLGEGTGLGLATVYGIVKQNRGFINVYSEPGLGTTFTIYLPRYVGNAEQAKTKETVEPSQRGCETILLVEDEQAILTITTIILTKQGYTVLAANSPSEAIHLASEHPNEIHLLMTDVVMPEMNGRDLAKKLQSIYPRLKCLYMSGYTANVIAHHGVLDAGLHFIQKPYNMNALADKLREVLDSKLA